MRKYFAVTEINVIFTLHVNKPDKIMAEEKTRYSDAELAEFKELILKKLETARADYELLRATITHTGDNDTEDTSPTFKVLEEGATTLSKEESGRLAAHQMKFIRNLEMALVRIENKTYGICKTTGKLMPQLALDYARVERCAPGEAAPRVRALIQQQRDALEEMSTLIREIDASHIRYRKRAVQRAQFLLLSDRSSQGSVTALLRRYAEDIRTPDQLFEPDDGPVAAHLHLYPAAAFGEKFLYPPAAPRTAAPLAPVQAETLDPDQLRKEQQLLLDYARLAVTEENVALLAQQALAARPQVEASTLAEEYPGDFARIIGLHTYSQSPHRNYDIRLTGNWVERGGFRFEDFILTRRKEENDGND